MYKAKSSLMKPRIFVICNALDDLTRLNRQITTDSPAASRKIFMLCRALKMTGVKPCILSLGRGKAIGSFNFFSFSIRRINGVPVVYLPFTHIPLLSEIYTLISQIGFFIKRPRNINKAIIFYNRSYAYISTLIVSVSLGYTNILDLEDGEVRVDGQRPINIFHRFVQDLYDRLCAKGALLACSHLSEYTNIRRTLCYYGVADFSPIPEKFQSERIKIILSGTLDRETGAELFIESLKVLRVESPLWARQLEFEVTGYGSSAAALFELSKEKIFPMLNYHGRTTDLEYKDILDGCDVGLALKLNNGVLSNTTFPSKIVEFAQRGLLVLTTDISDVRKVIGNDGALFLKSNSAKGLIDLLQAVVSDVTNARNISARGHKTVLTRLNPERTAKSVTEFIFGETSYD